MFLSSLRETIRKMNHNVKLSFLFSIFQSFGRGIWMGNVLSAYIFFFGNESNTLLGWTSAATGITLTIFVFPAGFLADKLGRDRILKTAGVIGTIGLGLLFFGKTLVYIFAALALWGLFQALSRPSLESILADSIESGKRSKIYTWLHLARQVAMSIGPFANVALFLLFGDKWDLTILKNVMLVGLTITLASIILMFFFSDKKSLGKSSESIEEEITHIENNNHNGFISRLSQDRRAKLIPILLVGSNIIIGFGAGMTIKFFTIFFLDKTLYGLSPIWVQIIMGVTAIFTGISSIIAQRYSVKRGRAAIIFVVQLLATICLFAIAFYPPIYLLIPLFVARGSLMNAGQPLSRSILMDVVPKKNRGKWNSLETFAWGFFWNFSAVIGGYLVGDIPPYNYRLNFIVTACIYLLGIVPILFLIPLVGKEKFSLSLEN
ncbi:MAG: MFS transporter [Candidatus Heimdallarchaeaceae archaeon]